MKVLIVSDIHANRVALQTVLAAEPDCEPLTELLQSGRKTGYRICRPASEPCLQQ